MKKAGMIAITMCILAGMTVGCTSSSTNSTTAAVEESQTTTAAEENQNADTAKDSQAADADEEDQTAADEEDQATADGDSQAAGETVEILVAAAASLKNVYEEELIPMFQEQNPGIVVKGTYDSSGKLQTQIEEGLEADVFMSAAIKQMQALDEEGWIASETIVNLLENKLVMIVPSGQEEGFLSFEDIEKADSIALGDPESVPAGQYAKEALTSLGLWEDVLAKSSLGTNVTEVLNQVAAASADAGIVYATDAASMADKVTVIAEAPEGSLSDKVIYPVAVVANTSHREEADRFVDFLTSPEAMEVFRAYGFDEGK